ncbi:MAG: aminoacyl-histidine dipeptidase, partial [Candidatus Niameybacter stercoravium]|nr:aminoacyl-histidine dipeptidase [Candidatus Niameybacter stercoravium]
MARILENLQPEKVFYYFEEISKIPRGSGNEKAISDYMVQFAKSLNLEVKQDEANNIYIRKPATPGYEDAPTVILQGHMDM